MKNIKRNLVGLVLGTLISMSSPDNVYSTPSPAIRPGTHIVLIHPNGKKPEPNSLNYQKQPISTTEKKYLPVALAVSLGAVASFYGYLLIKSTKKE